MAMMIAGMITAATSATPIGSSMANTVSHTDASCMVVSFAWGYSTSYWSLKFSTSKFARQLS